MSVTHKNIKLTIESLIEKLLKVSLEINRGSTCELIKDDKEKQIEVIIPGKAPVLIQCWETKNGLTISSKGGNNVTLGDEILNHTLSNADTIKTVNITFDGIKSEAFDKVCKHFSDYATLTEPNTTTKSLNVSKGKYKVTVQYFSTTKKLLIQGKSNIVFDEVYFEVVSKSGITAEVSLQEYLTKAKSINASIIKYDDDIMMNFTIALLGDSIYNDKAFLQDTEKDLIKASIYMIYSNLHLPEYLPAVVGCMIIVEGILHRALRKVKPNHNAKSTMKEYYMKDNSTGLFKFNNSYSLSSSVCNVYEDLYNFHYSRRHKHFHNDGVTPQSLSFKDAKDILEEVVTIIKKAYKYKNSLY